MGYLPWIFLRGILSFGLLICSVIFTINELKGDVHDNGFTYANPDMTKGKKKVNQPLDYLNLYTLAFTDKLKVEHTF